MAGDYIGLLFWGNLNRETVLRVQPAMLKLVPLLQRRGMMMAGNNRSRMLMAAKNISAQPDYTDSIRIVPHDHQAASMSALQLPSPSVGELQLVHITV